MEGRYLSFTPTQVDDLVAGAAASLHPTLDVVAPLKEQVVNQRLCGTIHKHTL